MKKKSVPRKNLPAILTCFFCSGAAGLIYQVAWVKALGLIFGHTVFATATALAVFMAGVGAGSLYVARWSEQRAQLVVLYARIEFLVAATGALSLAGLAGVSWLYGVLYPAVGGSQTLLLVVRFLGAAVVLFVPTFLMGGTFPILVQSITQQSAELGTRVSQLYWVNTLGAAAGTLISGFVLLPEFGLRLTIASAVALNILAGLVALRIASKPHVAHGGERSSPTVGSPATDPPKQASRFLLFMFAGVGGTAFAYEIGWTRLLAATIGSSTYAFTLIVATFLAGTVIGSAIFQRFRARSSRVSLATFSSTQTWAGIAGLSSLILFHWTPEVIPVLLEATHKTFSGLVLAQIVTTTLTVLPVALVFGFNFPMVVTLFAGTAGPSSGLSPMVGKAYAANTLGAIVGSLITGFWLVPWLGGFRVVAVAAGVNVLLALLLEFHSSQRRMLHLATNSLCLLIVLIVASSSFFYNRSLLSLSAVLYGNAYQGHLTLSEIAATNDLVFMADGINDSIAVVRSDDYVALRVNGKTDASTRDTRTQLLLGHLGTGLHPAPRRVLIIGFGSGMTVSAVARYPDVERIDCVEIEPAVLRAAPYLDSLNRGVLSDPRVHVTFDDARNFLLTSSDKYDLIISEPSNPWIAGIGTLFTAEYYSAVRQRLMPGGIFVQWAQAYSLAPADLRMIAATLAAGFAELSLWHAEGPDLLLLCRTAASPVQFAHLRSLWQNPALRSDFATLGIHQPEGLVAYYLLDDAAVRKLSLGSKLNTDDRTLLEYHAPQTVLTPGLFEANQELITQLRQKPLPTNLEESDVGRALEAGALTALDTGDALRAKDFLVALKSQPESAPHSFVEGRLALMQGALTDAKSFLEAAVKQDPDSPEAMHWLATAEHRSGEDVSARSRVDQILKRYPRFLPALTDEMEFAADRRDFRIALIAQLNRMAVMPDVPASEYCRLGAIWIKMSDLAEAEPVLLRGTLKDPYSYACHLELGELYRETGRLPLARQHFELVVRFYPDYEPTIFRSLAGVYLALGDRHAAMATVRKGLRLFPDDPQLQKAVLGN
ncbi:MAG TPA: fused MFS/spermidine synthase [Candidatus Saccharimonadales bacterium]|nr:fused MFS/spermidine synthase [Candidatus Saccharimonadales bacterium]